MNRRVLGLLGIALAVACWIGLLALRYYIFQLPLSIANVVAELGLVLVGSVLFWRWILGILRRQAAEVQQHADQMKALHEASIALTTEYELRLVLQKVVDLSRELTRANYSALGILDEEGKRIDQFITTGMSADIRTQIGRLPQGEGLLGPMIHQGISVRSGRIGSDERSAGFPPYHPQMESFLGVPIASKGQVFGNLYVADKMPNTNTTQAEDQRQPTAFTEEDQEILEMFAGQAAIAIENAKLYRQNQQIAIMQERERIGMDLHDGVIQSIYAIGLVLDDTEHRLSDDTDMARQRIGDAIRGLNDVIQNIRSYIHDLQSHQFRERSLVLGLEELARGMQMYSLLDVQLELDSGANVTVSPDQTNEILHIAQEALINTRKHADASTVKISLTGSKRGLSLIIEDDGIGLGEDGGMDQVGLGLHNMRERTHRLGGSIELSGNTHHGTRLSLFVPLSAEPANP